ncbi:hypothetical protein GCM10027275_09230 [Rhabdobacter roseus]|uniref:Thiol-disulfide isomerase/thioredoxin n=1 Tax=Rhabdobacter roseus TaxID=1655419 RepID=A0A840TH84_9BACT|nr:TlpA disulfide reductase family protein [Rhabdobacter roseus]MBB5282824.1 thiol-disulfide isomerase/thioredoxin [Rhabdobacter roseus]
MNKLLFFCALSFCSLAFAQEPTQHGPLPGEAPAPNAQPLVQVKWETLDTLLHHQDSDTTYIINFWATWCRPCVAELPHFEEVQANFAHQKVRVLLVSMDFAKDIEDRVVPFIERHNIKSTVWLLNETDANRWIERVDSTWSGALPATLILNPARGRRSFYEKPLDYETLARELSYFTDY